MINLILNYMRLAELTYIYFLLLNGSNLSAKETAKRDRTERKIKQVLNEIEKTHQQRKIMTDTLIKATEKTQTIFINRPNDPKHHEFILKRLTELKNIQSFILTSKKLTYNPGRPLFPKE